MLCGLLFHVLNIAVLLVVTGATMYYIWPALSTHTFATDLGSLAQYVGAISSAAATVVFVLLAVFRSSTWLAGLASLFAITDAVCYFTWGLKGTLDTICTGAQSLTNEVSADASALIGKYSPCSAEWMRTALIVVRLLDPFFLQRRQRTDLRILTLLHPRSGFHANLLRQTPSVHAHPHQIVSVSGSLQLSIALTALSNSGCSSSRGGASGPAAAAAPAQSLGRPATGGMRSLGTRLAHRRGRYARVGGTRSSAGLAGSDEDEDEERRLRGRGDGQGSSGEGESDLDEAPWTEEGRRAPRVVV
ncbi:hypothetical protein DMC30DRAFT_233089 [Rhodotorula diobovata]|uniref:Uncharacterized protein n=1 Tax=Rhodotorula diobovata TaxID=5288 RepID=A0A5C5FVD4_9BASI|nr:hypothetical protein DMC30DRAFT_233089 [Rhodotorula diobovata]